MKNLYVIAEAGVNHNGSIDLAHELIRTAAEIGANAVKFQSFTAKELAHTETPKVPYQLDYSSKESHFEMLSRLEITHHDQKSLFEACFDFNIDFLSTPYSIAEAVFLNELGVKYFKIASADIVDLPLLKCVADFGKLTLLSTGMANYTEIQNAVNIFNVKKCPFVLLACTSEYPTPSNRARVQRIEKLREFSPHGLGYSDHTNSNIASILAVGAGATFLEKHLTLDNNLSGPDHAASLNPKDFANYVNSVQEALECLGDGSLGRTQGEELMAATSRKSLHASRFISKGEVLEEKDFILKRPGIGILYSEINNLIGNRASCDIAKGEIIVHDSFEI